MSTTSTLNNNNKKIRKIIRKKNNKKKHPEKEFQKKKKIRKKEHDTLQWKWYKHQIKLLLSHQCVFRTTNCRLTHIIYITISFPIRINRILKYYLMAIEARTPAVCKLTYTFTLLAELRHNTVSFFFTLWGIIQQYNYSRHHKSSVR